MRAKEILKRIEDHKGRKLDLNNHRDKFYLFSAIEREILKKDTIISNVKNVLSGFSTYDETKYRTISDHRKK